MRRKAVPVGQKVNLCIPVRIIGFRGLCGFFRFCWFFGFGRFCWFFRILGVFGIFRVCRIFRVRVIGVRIIGIRIIGIRIVGIRIIGVLVIGIRGIIIRVRGIGITVCAAVSEGSFLRDFGNYACIFA